MCLIWRERENENWWDLRVFCLGPPKKKKYSPNGEKMGEKRWDYHFRQIWPHVLAFFFWLLFVILSSSLFFPLPPPLPLFLLFLLLLRPFHPLCNLIQLLSLSFSTKLSPKRQSLFFLFFFFYIYIYVLGDFFILLFSLICFGFLYFFLSEMSSIHNFFFLISNRSIYTNSIFFPPIFFST